MYPRTRTLLPHHRAFRMTGFFLYVKNIPSMAIFWSAMLMLTVLPACDDTRDAVQWSVDLPEVTEHEPATVRMEGNVPYLAGWINDTYASFLMDTGSSLTFINGDRYGHSGLEVVHPDSLTVLNATWHAPLVIYDDMGTDTGVPDGIVGMDRLLSTPWQMDYSRKTVLFMDSGTFTPPEDEAIDMELAGGGYFSVEGVLYHIVPNRLLVHTLIEGVPATCVLDTGASYVALRKSFLDTLPDTQRQYLGTVTVYTARGFESVDLFGIEWVSLEDGRARVDSPTGFALPDDSFDSVDEEIGSTVDCFLGGSYLRHFTLTFDGPGGLWYLTDSGN